ncbi:MAG TPA: ATP-dependent DNA ligase [Vicinamibacterales bacterium]|nr:ATP-dependent DNA ligase [Vicinamibacterales bacterium]
MRLTEVVAASGAVGATAARLEKIGHLSSLLQRVPVDEIAIVIAFLSGETRQGRIGIGYALLSTLRDVPPADAPSLELADVDATFDRIAAMAGAGSSASRAQLLRQLLERATAAEQDFLIRLLFGELRQGALEGVLTDAVARAARIPPAVVRRAAMLAGDLAPVARAALVDGEAGLAHFILSPFQPVLPMLADSAADVGDALGTLGEASLEYKLDGARIQVHKVDDEVKVYSRNLRDVTIAVPEVVSVVRAMPARTIVLDGEAIALRSDGTPHPFQTTMRRFGRKLDVEALQAELPITPMFFDALYLDGAPLVDEPLVRRLGVVDEHAAAVNRVPRIVTANAVEASDFAARAIATGHEGVMAKAVDGVYAAGRRGQAWLKVKQARTLDLVILAVEWGSGRRKGWLSNLHLGARDAERGGFVMLGKTFKGLTDEMLAWQTTRFLEIEIGRDAHTVYLKPEVVAEIAFNEIQASSQYPGGLALRFARVKRYRSDKAAAEADTFATIQSIYQQTTGLPPPVR